MRVYVIHISSRYPSLTCWTHWSVLCKTGDVKGLSLSASRTDCLARSRCPRDCSSQCIPSCGAPAHPPRSTCTTSNKVNLLGSTLPTKAKMPWPTGPTAMLTNETQPNASSGGGQCDGPSPPLLSPRDTLLPGLGPRPTSLSSWPLPWGCSTGKAPTGGPFCDPSSGMGAAPHSGATAVSQVVTLAPSYITTDLTPRAPLSHYDHQHQRLNKKWHEGPTSSTSPRSPEPGSHSVTRASVVTGGLGSGPPSRVQGGGRGCRKHSR